MIEMEYSDGGNAMTLANKNRVASKKIFEQLQQSTRTSNHITLSDGFMLHRQPSGAQKRIRQRQEQKWLRAISINTGLSNVDHNRTPPVPEKNAYRSLIDSGGYKSILPEELPLDITSFSPLTKSTSAISDSSNSPSVSVATSTIKIDNSTGNTSLIITVYLNIARSINSFLGGKPTVQVHPMPSNMPTSSVVAAVLNSSATNSITNIVPEKVREKPAVPKKPAKLILPTTSTAIETVPVTPLSLSTSNLNLFSSSAQSSPSTSNSFRLFSSPSFMCLHNALMEPSLTTEEVVRLEAKRRKLIESITRKVTILDEERNAIDEDFNMNEALKNEVFTNLMRSGDSVILEKIEKNLAQNSQLCRLETRLCMQLERLQSISQSNENADKGLINARIQRLKQQLDDQTILRKAFDRRDAEVDKYVTSRLDEVQASQWRIYKETWRRLTTERQEIDERLFLGREQISALRNVQPHV
ncbi:unnamed protein product [Thelazia callipaeda]|uniref:ASD2 domain-containing protein n=1 Tax=Thelazia callipaeda TaxID=103827 RepID=A0A158RCE1_THECL|nr:unnamed protein product [Thelazia callipaeda]